MRLKQRIIRSLIKVSYAWPNGFLIFLQRLLYRSFKKDQVQRILIFRNGTMGDFICALPAFHAIHAHFPQATIDLLTNAGNKKNIRAEQVIKHAFLQDVIHIDDFKRKALRKELSHRQYDIVVELPQSLERWPHQIRNLIFFRSANIPSGIGWQVATNKFFKKTQLANNRVNVSESERLLAILNNHGIITHQPDFKPHIAPEVDAKISDLLIKRSIVSDKKVAIGIGAKLSRKQWPLAYFQEVISFLEAHEYTVVLIGGDADLGRSQELKGQRIHDFCGQLSPIESAALLKTVDFTIANDSGPMHLSYAVGTPVLGLFSGHTYPGKWYPPNDGMNKVLANHTTACAVCYHEACRDNICLQGIQPKAVTKLLEEHFFKLKRAGEPVHE